MTKCPESSSSSSTGTATGTGTANAALTWRRDVVQVALFVLALLLPGVGLLLGINDFEMLAENRRLAQAPGWPRDAAALDRFPGSFERYFDDHFGFRSFLVGRDKRLEWLGSRSQVEIQVGENEWLFQGSSRDAIAYHCVGVDAEALPAWRALGRERRNRLAAQGIAYYWVMVPNKHSIYPEQLPAAGGGSGGRDTGTSRRDCELNSLANALRADEVQFLDLRGPLRAAKSEGTLFHRTDTHWNQLGAWVGAREIVRTIREAFPVVPATRPVDYEVVAEPDLFAGNLAERLAVYGETYREEFLRLRARSAPRAQLASGTPALNLRLHSREDEIIRFSTGSAELPTAVVFHDSFGFALMEVLAEHFEHTTFVNSNSLVDHAFLARERPDLVISLFVEAKLRQPPPVDRPLSSTQVALSSH